jgi:hypothetical protein
MNFNWGHGIALFFTIFVCLMVYFVIKTTQIDHSLVSEQYYKDDLNYQEIIDKKKNVKSLGSDFSVVTNNQENKIEVNFPQELKNVVGTIKFMKPQNKLSDIIFNYSLDTSSIKTAYVVNYTDLKEKGKWNVLLEWSDGLKSYYHHQSVIVE